MKLFSPKKLLIIGVAIFAIGCSSSAATPSATPDKTDGVPVPSATAVVSRAPSGTNGGALTVVAAARIPHRDVHQEVQETLTALGPGLAYSRLLRLRSGEGSNQPNLLLECDLCQSWELNEDLAFVFKLIATIFTFGLKGK
jgi:hypothetical protein